jgi:hypothetical protein
MTCQVAAGGGRTARQSRRPLRSRQRATRRSARCALRHQPAASAFSCSTAASSPGLRATLRPLWLSLPSSEGACTTCIHRHQHDKLLFLINNAAMQFFFGLIVVVFLLATRDWLLDHPVLVVPPFVLFLLTPLGRSFRTGEWLPGAGRGPATRWSRARQQHGDVTGAEVAAGDESAAARWPLTADDADAQPEGSSFGAADGAYKQAEYRGRYDAESRWRPGAQGTSERQWQGRGYLWGQRQDWERQGRQTQTVEQAGARRPSAGNRQQRGTGDGGAKSPGSSGNGSSRPAASAAAAAAQPSVGAAESASRAPSGFSSPAESPPIGARQRSRSAHARAQAARQPSANSSSNSGWDKEKPTEQGWGERFEWAPVQSVDEFAERATRGASSAWRNAAALGQKAWLQGSDSAALKDAASKAARGAETLGRSSLDVARKASAELRDSVQRASEGGSGRGAAGQSAEAPSAEGLLGVATSALWAAAGAADAVTQRGVRFAASAIDTQRHLASAREEVSSSTRRERRAPARDAQRDAAPDAGEAGAHTPHHSQHEDANAEASHAANASGSHPATASAAAREPRPESQPHDAEGGTTAAAAAEAVQASSSAAEAAQASCGLGPAVASPFGAAELAKGPRDASAGKGSSSATSPADAAVAEVDAARVEVLTAERYAQLRRRQRFLAAQRRLQAQRAAAASGAARASSAAGGGRERRWARAGPGTAGGRARGGAAPRAAASGAAVDRRRAPAVASRPPPTGRVSVADIKQGAVNVPARTVQVPGLLRLLFGGRARARVRDTVRASRRPVLNTLLTVFPFLRSWGGFI